MPGFPGVRRELDRRFVRRLPARRFRNGLPDDSQRRPRPPSSFVEDLLLLRGVRRRVLTLEVEGAHESPAGLEGAGVELGRLPAHGDQRGGPRSGGLAPFASRDRSVQSRSDSARASDASVPSARAQSGAAARTAIRATRRTGRRSARAPLYWRVPCGGPPACGPEVSSWPTSLPSRRARGAGNASVLHRRLGGERGLRELRQHHSQPRRVRHRFREGRAGRNDVRVLTRVLMTPVHAKQLLNALGQNLALYEKTYGPIRSRLRRPEGRRPRAGAPQLTRRNGRSGLRRDHEDPNHEASLAARPVSPRRCRGPRRRAAPPQKTPAAKPSAAAPEADAPPIFDPIADGEMTLAHYRSVCEQSKPAPPAPVRHERLQAVPGGEPRPIYDPMFLRPS